MADQVRDLHAAIMNLPCSIPGGDSHAGGTDGAWVAGFKQGHRDARHAAAELAASHAAEVEALRSALEKAERRLFGAWQMLEAINEGDPSRDRKAAAERALGGLNEVRAALKGDKP